MDSTFLQFNSAAVFLESLRDFMGFGVLAIKDYQYIEKDIFIDESLSTGMTLEKVALPLIQMYEVEEIIEFGNLVDDNITLSLLIQQGGHDVDSPPAIPFLINHCDMTVLRQSFMGIFQTLNICNQKQFLDYIDKSTTTQDFYFELENPFMSIKPNHLTPTKTLIDFPYQSKLKITVDNSDYINPNTKHRDHKVSITFMINSADNHSLTLSTQIHVGLNDIFTAIQG